MAGCVLQPASSKFLDQAGKRDTESTRRQAKIQRRKNNNMRAKLTDVAHLARSNFHAFASIRHIMRNDLFKHEVLPLRETAHCSFALLPPLLLCYCCCCCCCPSGTGTGTGTGTGSGTGSVAECRHRKSTNSCRFSTGRGSMHAAAVRAPSHSLNPVSTAPAAAPPGFSSPMTHPWPLGERASTLREALRKQERDGTESNGVRKESECTVRKDNLRRS